MNTVIVETKALATVLNKIAACSDDLNEALIKVSQESAAAQDRLLNNERILFVPDTTEVAKLNTALQELASVAMVLGATKDDLELACLPGLPYFSVK
ncbi:hypothetical protein [Corynebacterium flavescens]|uniref:Uncharacterized protein n=1 Tax=Corynebacterium flavescens TaxID=28028 RepID=A0A1L7CNM7_CORFL|nr:hypothetical protein [Corynebacterium flavescens]APT87415.1 hypothetical protein CFLV_09670 [Corynebacterium flavescens]KAA8720503.1 hypothetical protein F4V60_09395 [Corynebacterium flavescens]GEB97729.1 hypothetical protein CFL01nite_12240 [Corynebacterium flavescens]